MKNFFLVSLLYCFSTLKVCASHSEEKAAFLELLSRTATSFTVNYDGDTNQAMLVSRKTVTGIRNSLAASLSSEPLSAIMAIRFVPFIAKEEIESVRLKAQKALDDAYAALRQKVPTGGVMNDPREFIPTSRLEWQLLIHYKQLQKSLNDLPTHHWKNLGMVINTDKLVTPDDPNDSVSQDISRCVLDVMKILEPYHSR